MAQGAVDEYLNKLPDAQKAQLQRIRDIVKATVPDAEELISYDMPAFKYKGKSLILFAAYKNHMSIFGSTKAVEDKLTNFVTSGRGTTQFTEDKPLPEELIKEILQTRAAEIDKNL